MILIGSKAANFWNINRTVPKDTDYFYWNENILNLRRNKTNEEFHKIPKNLFNELKKYSRNSILLPNALYTLKCSHFQWDVKWEKTKQDILWFRHKQNCSLIPELYDILVEYWTTVHGDKSFLSLKKTSKDFFNDTVHYVYDHDTLHEMVSYPDKPIYTKCLKDEEEVSIDFSKFNELLFHEKVKMFREEIHVIALERYLLNNYNNVDCYLLAYKLALKKTITNLTKNWASKFIITNLIYFLKPDIKLLKKVKGDSMSFETLDEDFKSFVKKAALIINEDSEDIYTLNNLLYDIANDEFSVDCEDLTNEYKENYEFIDQQGGGEGGAEYCFSVFKWKDKFYKMQYNYYSYVGFEYDEVFENIHEVFPTQKTITVYE